MVSKSSPSNFFLAAEAIRWLFAANIGGEGRGVGKREREKKNERERKDREA